jgi:hypothetical protein
MMYARIQRQIARFRLVFSSSRFGNSLDLCVLCVIAFGCPTAVETVTTGSVRSRRGTFGQSAPPTKTLANANEETEKSPLTPLRLVQISKLECWPRPQLARTCVALKNSILQD